MTSKIAIHIDRFVKNILKLLFEFINAGKIKKNNNQ